MNESLRAGVILRTTVLFSAAKSWAFQPGRRETAMIGKKHIRGMLINDDENAAVPLGKLPKTESLPAVIFFARPRWRHECNCP